MKKIYTSIIILLITLFIGNICLGANTLSEEEKEKNANKYLSSLEVSGYEISPEFNKNTIEYYVIIPKDISSIDINAIAEEDEAIVKITGNKYLTKQENTISIRVTAIDGTSRVYSLIAVKEQEVNLKLSSLQIDGIELDTSFNEDKYYYTSSIEDTELRSLNITAVANDDTANIEIIGADELVDGDNLINIILTNDDERTVYQVDLDVDFLGEKEKEVDNVITKVRKIVNYSIIGFIGLIVLIIVIIIISLIVKHKRRNNNNENKEDNEK